MVLYFFFFSSRRRHTRCSRDWSSDVCSSDLEAPAIPATVPSRASKRSRSPPRFSPNVTPATTSRERADRKSTRLNSSHGYISYAVFCLKKKKENKYTKIYYESIVNQ